MRALFDLPAPAKLNLFLHITGRRADGYHLLQSVFVLIDWCDTLHIERRADGRLQRHDLGAALPADDLCLRAAAALQQASGCTLGADIHIDKHVPWGAGLGGGSSDAATTLLALNRLWGLNWPRERLLQLGLRLGADVPFFVGGRNAWVEGIGEQLTPIDLPPACWAVLKPAMAIPTQAIFTSPLLARTLLAKGGNAAIVADFLAAAEKISSCGGLKRDSLDVESPAADSRWERNDLQEAALGYSAAQSAERGADDLAQALDLLRSRYGSSRMSGSGSAVFAPAGPNKSTAVPMFEPNELPEGWVGRLCSGLGRHPLCDWAAG